MPVPHENVVLITGASGGIGWACVQAFLREGARVALADVEPPTAEQSAQLPADRTLILKADISNPDSVRAMIDRCVARFGRLDVLVNNAAALRPELTVQDTSIEQLERLLAVNVRGTFLCCQHAYPHLRATHGCVVNVSSMSGVHGEKSHAAYAATKGAINALTQSMAIDWGADGIRVNAVCPSSVLTPNVGRIIASAPDPTAIIELRKKINLRGYTASPDEIASVIMFLASPAASFMTGALIPVSGGSECGYGIKY